MQHVKAFLNKISGTPYQSLSEHSTTTHVYCMWMHIISQQSQPTTLDCSLISLVHTKAHEDPAHLPFQHGSESRGASDTHICIRFMLLLCRL